MELKKKTAEEDQQQKWCHFLKVYIINNHLLIQTLSTTMRKKK